MRWLAYVALAAASSACGEDVSGRWCGKRVSTDAECVGDDVGMLLLKQNEDTLGGQACEALDHDCHIIEKGRVDGREVRFHYSFEGGYVDAVLTLEGNLLTGKLYASKCNCQLAAHFHRLD